MISGLESTCQSAAGIGPGQLTCFSQFKDSEESPNETFVDAVLGSDASRGVWQYLGVVTCQNNSNSGYF